MDEIQWTPQQEEVLDWFENGEEGSLACRARAGSSKTTCVIEGAQRSTDDKVLIAAFNKRIADEAKSRIDANWVEARTLHSIGFEAIHHQEGWDEVTVAPGAKRAIALTDAVAKDAPFPVRKLVTRLHIRARENFPHARAPEDLLDLAVDADCDPATERGTKGYSIGQVCEYAYEAMLLAAEGPTDGAIDFSDMIYLPIRNNWLKEGFDLVVIDEAQDMTTTQLEIATSVGRGRIAVVGDDRQAIYGFRGADTGSIDRLKSELDAIELPLTITFRCPLAVVAEAQQLVPDLQPWAGARDGIVRAEYGEGALIAQARPGDFVLSRINAPTVRIALALLQNDVRARIEGKDIGEGLRQVVEKAQTQNVTELISYVIKWESGEVDRLTKLDRMDLIDLMHDKVQAIFALSAGANSVNEVVRRIDRLFSDDGKPSVVISTIHKAKGLEADRVFLLQDTLYPRNNHSLEEENVEYVAVTRAKHELVRVSGVN